MLYREFWPLFWFHHLYQLSHHLSKLRIFCNNSPLQWGNHSNNHLLDSWSQLFLSLFHLLFFSAYLVLFFKSFPYNCTIVFTWESSHINDIKLKNLNFIFWGKLRLFLKWTLFIKSLSFRIIFLSNNCKIENHTILTFFNDKF